MGYGLASGGLTHSRSIGIVFVTVSRITLWATLLPICWILGAPSPWVKAAGASS